MRRAPLALATLVLAGGAVVAACGGGSVSVVRPGTSSTSAPPTHASSQAVTSTSAPATHAAVQTLVVTPSTRLKSGQAVTVHGVGFTPGEPLQVIQCAAKQQSTGPGDCNLLGMLTTVADATGRVSVRLVVVRGPFGANRIVCDSRRPCLVSVTQASLAPSEEADAPISFAAPAG